MPGKYGVHREVQRLGHPWHALWDIVVVPARGVYLAVLVGAMSAAIVWLWPTRPSWRHSGQNGRVLRFAEFPCAIAGNGEHIAFTDAQGTLEVWGTHAPLRWPLAAGTGLGACAAILLLRRWSMAPDARLRRELSPVSRGRTSD